MPTTDKSSDRLTTFQKLCDEFLCAARRVWEAAGNTWTTEKAAEVYAEITEMISREVDRRKQVSIFYGMSHE